jgi:hypothetical protein
MELTSDICKLAIRSHLEPGLITSWFWLGPFMALAFIREDHWVYRFLLRKFEYGTGAKFPELQGSTKFPSSWHYEQIHEQSHELNSANISPEGFNWVRKFFVHTSHKL